MINKAILIGNVGKDPEIKTFEGGNSVASFSLATSESYKDRNGQKQQKTEWHNISIWGKLVDVVERYVKKGDRLYLEGKITTRQWEDKEGNKRYTTEIICNQMTMLGGQKVKEEVEEEIDTSGIPKPNNDLPF